MLQWIVDFLGRYLSGWLGYLIIFAGCFGESAVGLGLIVPGESLAILGGVYSSPDAHLFIPPGNTPLTLPLVALAVTLGAVLGDNTGFFLGFEKVLHHSCMILAVLPTIHVCPCPFHM